MCRATTTSALGAGRELEADANTWLADFRDRDNAPRLSNSVCLYPLMLVMGSAACRLRGRSVPGLEVPQVLSRDSVSKGPDSRHSVPQGRQGAIGHDRSLAARPGMSGRSDKPDIGFPNARIRT